ncbi:anucleate primary sterigmata (ApsB) [Aspergillus rambellii]|uniref:Anucleate primary sterigmata (ApsB) n=2 Tax=Aspergillus subgen. Nidulantes TaxID=2720870 RepID=A0A0F8UQD6_9EURO|nr:anucleate primary sterigmata (ApsB) [Aspergillus ochraceoroseus]KKK21683.1 anucleate primary sterigmata (ApsB) [Aspergillus rambellii]
MSTGSAQPSSSPSPTLDALNDNALALRRLSLFSFPGGFDLAADLSALEDEFCDPFDFVEEEDTRGVLPPNNMDATAPEDGDHHNHHISEPATTPSMSFDDNPTITTALTHQDFDQDDSIVSLNLPPLPDHDDSSLEEHSDRDRMENQTFLEEREMRRKLMEMESSFLPEPSTIEVAAANRTTGIDDTYVVGVTRGELPEFREPSWVAPDESSHDIASTNDGVPIPQSPIMRPTEDSTLNLDATPSASGERYGDNTTMLETMPSSPAAAAAARLESRSQSNLHESADDISPFSQDFSLGQSLAPDGHHSVQSINQDIQTAPLPSPSHPRIFSDTNTADTDAASRASSQRSNRPKYLTSRQSAHRLSYSSATSNATEATNSDATLGADYALQSGGAVPGNPSLGAVGHRNNLARSVSLGSMASGISGYSDETFMDKRNPSGTTDSGLHTLDEEEGPSHSRPGSSQQPQPSDPQPQQPPEDISGPMTPKAKSHEHIFPTDTVIAERVRDIQVPSTFVKQFREDFGGHGLSPEKRVGMTPGFAKSGRSMTLKEQSSTIDRLSKENFDLKMRIHFLNEALNRRSEEGIKEMISENVELKSDKLKLQKENQGLKRKIRDLEKQVKDQQSDKESMLNHDPEGSDEEDRDPAQDEELLYLRERVETYELEIERLRSESIARESEKRRLAEMVKSLSDGRLMGSDVGAREERDMWKDMLEAETAAREQAEDENKRLREEVMRAKSEVSFAMAPVQMGHRDRVGSMVSYSGTSDKELLRNTTADSSSSSTLVMELELLKQENAELRKEVSAQTSMLTSRNREKERLYQEIEDLKLGQRRERSITGDSILDRSASRAHGRSSSRTSDQTGQSPIDDAEREDLEVRNGQLRDQVSALKLENQAIRAQLEDYVRELESLDKAYQADVDQAEEEIQTLQQERDQALQMADERDAAFQELRAEAQEELDALGDELDQKAEECQRLGEELRSRDENLRALQAEMRSAGEGIIRLEEDAQNNLQRYKIVQQELEECSREMESLEKSLYEANTKVQRLMVQIESSHNEIAFLREEQDSDKIKIGDLESELKTYQISLQSEKEKTRELEERLAEERHQREVVGSKEKQEVQRIVNELNREASTAKEEARKLKKSLSAQEIETATWRERLTDLENNLRETLGDLTGSRSSLISNIMKLQKELESTALELESTRSTLDEKESLLRNRDALLESHGLESRKLAELLERERQARRADKQSFESSLKSHHQASRTITQNNSRISELESARAQDRKRYTSLEQQFREQLNDRNAMLLTIWKRLSAMCGPDWAHSNSLINGNLPSQEVIGNILFWPGFSKNLLLAVKTLESAITSFKGQIKDVERDLTKQYQTVEHAFSLRIKKLDRLEESLMKMRAQMQNRGQSGVSSEMAKLRRENRLLNAELNLLQSHSRSRGPVTADMAASPQSPTGMEAERGPLVRHHSAIEQPSTKGLARSGIPQPSQVSSTTTLVESAGALSRPRHKSGDPGNHEVWIKRLHELEKRLKAEREARLLDRSGARKRLEEQGAENKRLRAQIERQRVRYGISTEPSTDDDGGRGQSPDPATGDEDYRSHRDDEHSSSEGEVITVDIEV